MRMLERARAEELAAARAELRAAVAAEHRLHQLAERHEREAERWRARAEWARGRGEADLAAQAERRSQEHRRQAARLRDAYVAESARIRTLKRHLRDLEVGRGPPTVIPSLALDPLAARFEALQREERLERELADLKARLSQTPNT